MGRPKRENPLSHAERKHRWQEKSKNKNYNKKEKHTCTKITNKLYRRTENTTKST